MQSAKIRKTNCFTASECLCHTSAIAEMIESTLERMRWCSQGQRLNIETHLLKPMYEESLS